MRRCADIYMIVPRMKGKASESMGNRTERIVKKCSFPEIRFDSIDFYSFILYYCNPCARLCSVIQPSIHHLRVCLPSSSKIRQGNLISIYICKNHYILSCFCIVLRFKRSNLRICKYERVFPGTVTTSRVLCISIHAHSFMHRSFLG